MGLQSQLFSGDPNLEAAAVSDPAHIVRGAQGPHVGKIQLALIQTDGANIDQDSSYGPATAAAVRDFKQKRQILNFAGQIDDIVGKKTIAALDAEMLVVEKRLGGGGLLLDFKITPTIIDFLVRFRAGSFRPVLENIDLTVYRTKLDRRLVPIDSGTNVGDPNIINAVISKIDTELKDPTLQQGVILIYGNSAGGRNALELCQALALHDPKRPIKFVGIADAALFGNLPGMNKPIPGGPVVLIPGGTHIKAINKPEWNIPPPPINAEIKHNFFQDFDNVVGGLKSLSPIWSSVNPNGEIHGKLNGFQINDQISIPIGQGGRAHDIAGDEGDRRNQVTITGILSAL